MARGLDKHRARLDALSLLGKDLARRSGRKCELCEAGGVRLDPREVEPLPEEPTLDQTVLLCARCAAAVAVASANAKKLGDLAEFRFLETAAWSEVAPVQVEAVRLLRKVADAGAGWAQALNESLYLAEDVAAWIDGAAPERAE